MTEITYYSILKNNQLCLPWSDDDKPAQKKLQDDKEAQLAALVGEEMPVDKLFNTGVITIYTQDLLENFINKQKNKSYYLQNAFFLIDDLDKKFKFKDAKYLRTLYLVAALSQKNAFTQKMNWLLNFAAVFDNIADIKSLVNEYKIRDWSDFDYDFLNNLFTGSSEAPIWSRQKVNIQLSSLRYQYYFEVAQSFQDIRELLKVDDNQVKLDRLQNEHSLELLHMNYELSKFFPDTK
ncbi:hypothetical protein [Companilactobacillus insicii]|uniref:hypothetical protein n=1 Tax=Companilactobacillus insicii TaxID=1732567 RepID=UPI000F7B1240|nr:hypothetical protein [Companilactobacillus insicii]